MNNFYLRIFSKIIILQLIIFLTYQLPVMSTAALKKQSSYSQFRRKNSLSKNNLHKSLIDIQNSISIIADEKTQQLSSIEQQLQSIVRNRSLSNKTNAKPASQVNLKINISKNLQPQNSCNVKPRRNSLSDLNSYEMYQKSSRSINMQGLSQTFQIIQQSQMHNQQDNGFNETKQQVDSNFKKIKAKYEKVSMQKKKQNGLVNMISTQKIQSKTSINELDQMQKRLQSAKKLKKVQIKQKKVKKQQFPVKTILKAQKRLVKTTSQTNFFLQSMKQKVSQNQKQKQLTPKLVSKKKILTTSESTILGNKGPLVKRNNQNQPTSMSLIPTKMVTSHQKQKLAEQLQKIKLSILNADICVQNVQKIRKMMKAIQGLIN